MSANVKSAEPDPERVEKIILRLGELGQITMRLERKKKGGIAHHPLRPEVRGELVRLLAELDALIEKRRARQCAQHDLKRLVKRMRTNAADAKAKQLADEYEKQQRQTLQQHAVVDRDPVVELTAFFRGAFVRSSAPPPDWNSDDKPWKPSKETDDPAMSRAVYVAVEIARRVFGNAVARPLKSPVTSTRLSKLHDNREREHGYVNDGSRIKQTLWTPERWAQFNALASPTIDT